MVSQWWDTPPVAVHCRYSMATDRWGIIGCGSVCEVKSGPGFQQAEGSELVAVMRRDRERAEAFAGRLGQLRDIDVRFANDAQAHVDPARLLWRVQAEHAGAGLFLDLASHTVDLLDFLLGPLQQVEGEASNVAARCDVEDRVSLRFR